MFSLKEIITFRFLNICFFLCLFRFKKQGIRGTLTNFNKNSHLWKKFTTVTLVDIMRMKDARDTMTAGDYDNWLAVRDRRHQ